MRPRSLLGHGLLIVLLPLAAFAMVAPPNEYRAMGVEAVDCDGPITVLMAVLPLLAVYGVAAAVFLSDFRRRSALWRGLLCGLICLGLGWAAGRAVLEQARNSHEAVCADGL